MLSVFAAFSSWIERGVAVSKIGKILAKAAPLQALSHLIPNDLVQAELRAMASTVSRPLSVAFDDVVAGSGYYGQIFSSVLAAGGVSDILLPLWKQLLATPGFTLAGSGEWLVP